MARRLSIEGRMRREEKLREKTDGKGNKWRKLYLGGGAHFRNWLEQCKEIYGEQNLEIEEVEPTGFRCFEESGEKMYRIWARVERSEQ